MRNEFLIFSIVIVCVNLLFFRYYPQGMWSLVLFGPLILLGFRDMFQKRHAIKANFPVLGHFRYILESIRPEINQYFVESNTDGKPFSREERSIVYQRAKRVLDTIPFGTQHNVYALGYEFITHSMYPTYVDPASLRITIGSDRCTHAYSCSLLNISAMSFGSLSTNAVLALNGGARDGNFAHNTGEGGVSPYHLSPGGDLIWQIGTGYFGCRGLEGGFDPVLFHEKATLPQIKMIEIKLSQGAKPGHGGILPGKKVNAEIAKIRNVKIGLDVISPPGHTAFADGEGLVDFIQRLRELSGGKPIGIKMSLGHHHEFNSLLQAMVTKNNYPDYIVVDGGEGGTGASPLEFTNYIGTPGTDALIYVIDQLKKVGLKDHIKVIATGKITTAFDILRLLCLGADATYAARSMMLALGCIQALRCHNNKCPTGVATQDPSLVQGLHIPSKRKRVTNFHHETLKTVAEMIGAMGLTSHHELSRAYLNKRVDENIIKTYSELYPGV